MEYAYQHYDEFEEIMLDNYEEEKKYRNREEYKKDMGNVGKDFQCGTYGTDFEVAIFTKLKKAAVTIFQQNWIMKEIIKVRTHREKCYLQN